MYTGDDMRITIAVIKNSLPLLSDGADGLNATCILLSFCSYPCLYDMVSMYAMLLLSYLKGVANANFRAVHRPWHRGQYRCNSITKV